jgi:hypothetical protein
MVPEAPGRLSTSIGTPSRADSRSASSRATASDTPPAGNGTIILIGRAGNDTGRLISERPALGMLASCAMAGGCARAVAVLAAQATRPHDMALRGPHRRTARMAASFGNFAIPRQSRFDLRTSDINFLRSATQGDGSKSAERDSRQFLRYRFGPL